jgi:metal-sulfur cluster biosynthetic enzyme
MKFESVIMTTDSDESERVRDLLRTVLLPGSQRNIVAAGFVKDIEVEDTG